MSPNQNIRFTARIRKETTFINVDGEIDSSTANEFRDDLLKALDQPSHVLILRLKQVSYMDSSGIAVLLDVVRQARQRGKSVTVVEPSEATARALRMVDLGVLVNIYQSVEECAECAQVNPNVVRAHLLSDTELSELGLPPAGEDR